MADKDIVVALAGNPNSGKTTVFNGLTGARQHVGNWPGVTVEKKEGYCFYNGQRISIVDLPGVYSLTAYSLDEIIARDFIINEKPDAVIDVVDASNLERNLYLTVQLLEMQIPVVIALNMMDTAEARGYKIDVKRLEELLGIPVVPMVASKKQGIEELLKTVVEVAEGKIAIQRASITYSGDIENEITRLEKLLSQNKVNGTYSLRWMAVKLLENDAEITEKIKQYPAVNYKEILAARDESLNHLKKIHGEDAEMMIADARYGFISGLVKEVLKKPEVAKITRTERIDRIVLNHWLGIPIFLAILLAIFQLTFTASVPLVNLIDKGLSWLAEYAIKVNPEWLGSLLADGVIGGVGAVVAFVPVIFMLYLGLSILEDTGYLARAAFVMDKVMHKIGLHGRSFVSLILGFGCTVPAVMASRTIENPKDRLATILVTPLISCGARLPVYVLLAAAFFAAYQGLIVFSLYAIGIVLAMLMAWLFRKQLLKGEEGHFVMELPPYRLPTVSNVAVHVWDKCRAFLTRAGTFIFLAVFVIWLLNYFNILESVGQVVAPIFGPAGFGQWEAVVALIFGVFAKEAVVGAFGTLLGGETAVEIGNILSQQLGWTSLTAYAFMVMVLLYVPCIATLVTIKRETGSWKWMGFTILYTFGLAWVVSTLIYQVGSLFI